jgi:hypothetical protein
MILLIKYGNELQTKLFTPVDNFRFARNNKSLQQASHMSINRYHSPTVYVPKEDPGKKRIARDVL